MRKLVRFSFVILLLSGFLMTGCVKSKLIKQADAHADAGEWDEATFNYARILEKDPDNIAFRIKHARSRIKASRVHYKKAMEYLEDEKYDAAQLEFLASLLLDPTYKIADEAYRHTQKKVDSITRYKKGLEFLQDNNEKEARIEFKAALKLNPDNKTAREELSKFEEVIGLRMDGYDLNLKSTKPITLEFKNTGIKTIFGVLSKLSGVNFIFDSSLKDKSTSLALKDSTFKQALELLLATNNLKKKVASENTIIIYPSTPKLIKQYEQVMVKVFFLTNIEAKKAVNLLRTMIKTKDVFVHDDLNAIVIRDKPANIDLAEKILLATDLADAEVILEVEIMEVSNTTDLNIGINYPDSLPWTISNPDSIAQPSANGILLNNLSKGLIENSLITISPALINLKGVRKNAKILANPRIRVKNRGRAKIHIGEKVPIITASVSSTDTRTETVEYQDVGVKLDVEPIIRPDDEIDLKITLEVSTLGQKTVTDSGSIVYQIGTRNVETNLRLSDGETQIIGGLLNKEERDTVIKIPGLGDIPILGRLFSTTGKEEVDSEILLSITPHIVKRIEVPEKEVLEIWPESVGDLAGGESGGVVSAPARTTPPATPPPGVITEEEISPPSDMMFMPPPLPPGSQMQGPAGPGGPETTP